MSLLSRFFDTVRSWRRRWDGLKTDRRAGIAVEYLDHRQLLSVNFTGNVTTDFPANQNPGVVILTDPKNIEPVISPPQLAQIVKVSGFDINGIRVSYTPSDDTLSIGLSQPLSQQPGVPVGDVIAGDADNNFDDGTTSPAAAAFGVHDFPMFGGSEYMGAFLDLTGTGKADVVAGFSVNDPRSPKQYQVAQAIVDPNAPATTPQFGTELPEFEGQVFKENSPAHPNLEFSIAHFSQLYLQETGQALSPQSTFGVGAFGGSGDDAGITEEYFHEQPVVLSAASPAPIVTVPVLINPHSDSHIDTAHRSDIRVSVLGSAAFDVTKIAPGSVTVGGAHPIFSFDRHVNNDSFLDATFVFNGTDVSLPAGQTEATVTGQTTTGESFIGTAEVFNRNDSFYSPQVVALTEARQAARLSRTGGVVVIPPDVLKRAASSHVLINVVQTIDDATGTPASSVAATVLPADSSSPSGSSVGRVVSIPRREPVVRAAGMNATSGAVLSAKLRSSVNQYVRSVASTTHSSGKMQTVAAKAPRVSSKLQASINRYARSTSSTPVALVSSAGSAV